MEQRKNYQRVITTATTRARAMAPEELCGPVTAAQPPPRPTTMLDEIDSAVYDTKVRVNHWHDKMMEHKKIYYAAELKMYKLELALAKYDNSNKLRWSVRHREMANMTHRDEDLAAERAANRRTPEPAYGYVPITRRLKSESAPSPDEDGKKNREKSIDLAADDDEILSSTSEIGRNDVIPIHSEDYKPFSSTPSIHSYMYHLRKIYGK